MSGDWRWRAWRRRVLLFGLTGLQTWAAARTFAQVLPERGASPLEQAIVALFVVLFGWISLGFWTALAGFLVHLFGRGRSALAALVGDVAGAPLAPTAIVMPICNEDPARVFAGLRATYESLRATGRLEHFEFFILSDTADPDLWVEEERALADWLATGGDARRIHYRRRAVRLRRKTGNIADFCRRWGARFRYMIVFDADSVMRGETLVRMVQIMERRRRIGILQTAPRTVGRESLYARMQQFANHVYGPLFTAGLDYWQMGDGYYWGHNAIIRLAPFIEHCALARLPGRGALGGEVLSHDFVEAAWMRAAGWEVWLAHDLPGSYEEPPPTLLDELKRDRRWSQGNLQHLRLLGRPGLTFTHRIMFLYGMLAYGASLLWLALLGLSSWDMLRHVDSEPRFFPDHYTLYPDWTPLTTAEQALTLFSATATLLFLPKLLGWALRVLRGGWRDWGGLGGLTAGVLLETLLSALLAPVRMLFHSRYVLLALLGRAAGWGGQRRDDAETGWAEAFQRHAAGVLLATVWLEAFWWWGPDYLPWISPVAGALVAAPLLSVLTSRVRWGRALRRLGLFVIPAEARPERLLRDTADATARHAARLAGQRWRGFAAAVLDPRLHLLHLARLPRRRVIPPATAAALEELVARALAEGPDALDAAERSLLLRHRAPLARLHAELWRQRPAARARWASPAPAAAAAPVPGAPLVA